MKFIILLIAIQLPMLAWSKTKDCSDYSQYKDVSDVEILKISKEKSATILDVNSMEQFKKSHVDGAVHYLSNKENIASELPKDKNSLIVAYCGGKSCTAWQMAAKKACEMGYTNIKHYSNGITGWDKIKKS